jgi:two-component system, NarL family, response regulator
MTPVVANPIKLLIADDHPVFREGLVAIVSRQPDIVIVAQASDGREAVRAFSEHQPHVALMDLRMPVIDGVQAIVQIRERHPDARIVVLTTFDSDDDIYRGLHAGARSYILKDAPTDELLRCIRDVHAGRPALPLAMAAKLAERQRNAGLTPRELDVLALMAEGRTNRDIATALDVADGTIKVHVNNILTKLHASTRTEAVSIAVRRRFVDLR